MPPTDLIDRYIAEIARHLPPAVRAQVTAEIGGELRAQVRATEAHNGRAMTEEELSALIKMRGHPYVLAQPYRTGRYLFIGPSLMPQYFRAVKTWLTVIAVIIIAVTAVFAAAGAPPAALLQSLTVFGRLLVPVIVLVTIGYAVFDVIHGRAVVTHGWDPQTPSIPPEEAARTTQASSADVITSGLFLVWWLVLPHYPWVVLGPGAAFLRFSDGWTAAYPWVAACFVVALLVQFAALVRPSSSWLARWRTVVANAANAIGAGLLLGAGDLLVASSPGGLDAHSLGWINRAIRWCLVWTLVIGGWQMLRAAFSARTPRSEA